MNNNGNTNNNNKYNALNALPLAVLKEKNIEPRFSIPIEHIWEAYRACIRNKRFSPDAMIFNSDLERNIRRLWRELNDGTYEIGKSIAFIVERPKKREVFAASFRDKVVHYYVCLRLEPLFEKVLPDEIASNRKGKGTLYAVNKAYDAITDASNGYTSDAWIWKYDIQGFFMSIDKRILNGKVQALIDAEYHGVDIAPLKYYTEKIIMHCPQGNCIRKSSPFHWKGLAKNKSLFWQDKYHGMPIGNLPSQMFANYLLMFVVDKLKGLGLKNCVQFVDDGMVVAGSKQAILDSIPIVRDYMKTELGLTMHPKKCYIQHYTKGVAFIGGIVKPHRVYLSKRARRNALAKANWLFRKGEGIKLLDAFHTVNAYLGMTHHVYGYKIRKCIMKSAFEKYHNFISFSNDCRKMIVSRQAKRMIEANLI